MRTYQAPTLSQLHEGMVRRLAHATKDELDGINSLDVQVHEVLASAESMDTSWGGFDLKRLWLTNNRWTTMVKQYIDPDEFLVWIDKTASRIGTKKRGISVLRSKTVEGRGGWITGHTNRASRVWGSCMLSWSYKTTPRPTITMHSRTTYLGYIAALDLSVAWNIARYLGHEIGLAPEEFRFVWFVEAAQYHNFKSLAYFLNHPDPAKQEGYRRVLMADDDELLSTDVELLRTCPAIQLSRNWMRRFIIEDRTGVGYGDMNYNQYRRIRRRYHTEMYGPEYGKKFEGVNHKNSAEFFSASPPLPNVMVRDLDFTPIGLPLDREVSEA